MGDVGHERARPEERGDRRAPPRARPRAARAGRAQRRGRGLPPVLPPAPDPEGGPRRAGGHRERARPADADGQEPGVHDRGGPRRRGDPPPGARPHGPAARAALPHRRRSCEDGSLALVVSLDARVARAHALRERVEGSPHGSPRAPSRPVGGGVVGPRGRPVSARGRREPAPTSGAGTVSTLDAGPASDRYRWTALSNTTLGVFMATLDSSIVIISLPAIFRGLGLDPLAPGNIGYLLWILMGYLVVTAVLVVTFGRIGDMFGRVRMYNLGFLIFTIGSIALSLTWSTGTAGATELIVFRIVQGIGGALLFANATAILTDAFPVDQRGMAMGVNLIAGLVGSFTGLLVGGVLADVHWRLVFWVNVPFGLFGTIWAYAKLRDSGRRTRAHIDWWGNLTFGVGLVMVLVGITYGLQPAGGHTMGWTSPFVLTLILGGIALL